MSSTTVTRTVVTSSGGGTCLWNWSYFFSIMDVIVGGLVTAQGLVLVFTLGATFRMVVVGILAAARLCCTPQGAAGGSGMPTSVWSCGDMWRGS